MCLTVFAATSGLTVIAGSCSSHRKSSVETKCDKDDTECQMKKTEKLNLSEAIKS